MNEHYVAKLSVAGLLRKIHPYLCFLWAMDSSVPEEMLGEPSLGRIKTVSAHLLRTVLKGSTYSEPNSSRREAGIEIFFLLGTVQNSIFSDATIEGGSVHSFVLSSTLVLSISAFHTWSNFFNSKEHI